MELCLVSASTVLKPPLLTAVVTAAVGDCTETGGIGEQDEQDEKHKVGKVEWLLTKVGLASRMKRDEKGHEEWSV